MKMKFETTKFGLIKSWPVQVVAGILYVDYLVTLITAEVAIAPKYEFAVFDPISFAIQVVIMMALSMAIGALTAPKPPKPRHAQPTGLEQFSVPTAEEGRAIQVLFGKKYIKGPNVVWYGDLKSEPVVVRM